MVDDTYDPVTCLAHGVSLSDSHWSVSTVLEGTMQAVVLMLLSTHLLLLVHDYCIHLCMWCLQD